MNNTNAKIQSKDMIQIYKACNRRKICPDPSRFVRVSNLVNAAMAEINT